MPTALITGASSGLGSEFARKLAHAGYSLIISGRNEKSLHQLAEEIHTTVSPHASISIVIADLSHSDGIASLAHEIDACNDLDILVNNAGYGLGGDFLSHTCEQEDAALRVMVEAVLVLTHHATAKMKARGRGHIINLSSLASRMNAGTYCAHKAWVLSFSEGLAAELSGSGVAVTAVCPGATRTKFFERAHINSRSFPSFFWQTPEQVVAAALRASSRAQVICTPGLLNKIAMAAMKIAPLTLSQKVMAYIPHM